LWVLVVLSATGRRAMMYWRNVHRARVGTHGAQADRARSARVTTLPFHSLCRFDLPAIRAASPTASSRVVGAADTPSPCTNERIHRGVDQWFKGRDGKGNGKRRLRSSGLRLCARHHRIRAWRNGKEKGTAGGTMVDAARTR
jgi:hypothetical protein